METMSENELGRQFLWLSILAGSYQLFCVLPQDDSALNRRLTIFRPQSFLAVTFPELFSVSTNWRFSLAENCSQIQPLGIRRDDGTILTGSCSIAFDYSLS